MVEEGVQSGPGTPLGSRLQAVLPQGELILNIGVLAHSLGGLWCLHRVWLQRRSSRQAQVEQGPEVKV